MDFSFSFMQGIMGNTIQQPPQLIDSANTRQEGAYDTGSDPGEDGGPSYDAALEAEFSYPPSASEDMPQVSNGYPPGLGLYEPQAKFSMYSQFPNGSANGYGAIRGYGEHGLMPGEGTVLRGPGLQERPLSPVSPPLPSHHPHLHHHPHHHHHAHHYHPNPPHLQPHPHPHTHPQSPPPLPSQHHLPQTPHIVTHRDPPPLLLLPSASPDPSILDSSPSPQAAHTPSTPPAPPGGALKKSSSPEIKLKIIKTYQNGKELFESALCGDLLQELQEEDSQTNEEATEVQRTHERKKEKRKKSARLQGQAQEQALDQDQPQGGTPSQTEDTPVQPQSPDLPMAPTPRPQKTVVKAEPKTPKVPKVHHPSVIQETGFCKEFVIGDLVWSKVGTYPWWPCMVSSDPQMKVHTRINTRGHREYHVQFFGSVAERAWIHEKRIVTYQGKHQFDELQSETLRKTTNPAERHKLLKPIPQRERNQWEVGVGHAEDAIAMSRQERSDNYTFIYVDPDPSEPPPAKRSNPRPEKRTQRSSSLGSKREEVASPDKEQQPPPLPPPPRRQLPRRQCSAPNASDSANSQASDGEKSQRGGPSLKSSPAREDDDSEAGAKRESPPPVRAWKTAAARKLLPLSITMKKLNVEITKCDWPLLQRKIVPSPRKDKEEREERTEGEVKQPDLGYCSPEDCGAKPEASPEEEEEEEGDEGEDDAEERRGSPASRRSEEGGTQQTSSPGSPPSSPPGSQERKQQRRSVRSRSESERGSDPVPKKKTKKEQAEAAPETALRTGSQKGASEISDACKPLKKRSRASTDVEMASSQYRDTSDSDSRGLNDPQGLFGKSLDSPAAADADASDTQSVDSSHAGRRDTVCQICEVYGEGLVVCEGDCCRRFHLDCLGLPSLPDGKFTCLECRNGAHSCFSCKTSEGEVTPCSVTGCGCYYHDDCVRKLPGTTGAPDGSFSCPQHTCSTCCLERDLQRASKGRMMRCIRCPVAYHPGDGCVAAGSVGITHHVMICSSHSSTKRNGLLSSPINVGWCFLCARGLLVQDLTDTILSSYAYKSHYLLTESNRAELKLPMIPSSSSATKKNIGKGGKLLCCDSCPASFHPECLEMEMPEGAWSCRDCRAGKKPHYKQIVWVKLGNYRWWPAEICNPRLVPSNIQSLRHDVGDFPVFFFGSHDYYWINQGRVFPYVENDKNPVTGQININKTFKKALEEAARRFLDLKAQRESREALEQERNSRKPPPYKLIKSNKPVGKVQVHVADLSEIQRCNCQQADEHPCNLDSQCLNRLLQYECHPQVCPAGDSCENQCFSKRLYAETEVVKTEGRGWGLRTNQALRKGEFVCEYVGEVIDSEECQQRIKHAHENCLTNFYMLTLTKDRVIDAGPKGNFSRFMNHSCSPNCETQKWMVNGDVRIGLFTLCDIEAGTELTFNYNLDLVGNRRASCHCGADNCSGFLGVRPTSAVVMEKEEKARNAKLKPKKRKLRPEGKHTHEYFCFCCGEGGELVMCDKKDCPKAYHLLCLNLTKPPYGRWECPWHDCSVCDAPASSFCEFCPRSFCRAHEAGALTPSSLEGRPCCSTHDPLSPLGSNSNSTQPSSPGQRPGVRVKEEPEEEPPQRARE